MKKYYFLLLLLLSSCFVKVGYVWDKKFEPYEERTVVEDSDVFEKKYSFFKDDWVSVYKYTEYREYLVKDNEDYLITVKEKRGKNQTTYYVDKETYEELGIEHTFDLDIHGGDLWDSNNEKIFLRKWTTEENSYLYLDDTYFELLQEIF